MTGIFGGLLIVICPVVPSDMAKFSLLRYFPLSLFPTLHTNGVKSKMRPKAAGATQRVW